MLEFTDNITADEHDGFVRSHPLCSVLQASAWAKVKSNWEHAFVGLRDGGELKASALVLIRRLPLGLCAMYMPRGPVMDLEDPALVSFFFSSLRKWARRRRCAFVKFDPACVIREFLPAGKAEAPYKPCTERILANLKNAGARHAGFTEDLYSTAQPRYVMGIRAEDGFEEHVSRDAVKSRNAALKKHVRVERYGREMLDEFAALMQLTADRKDIYLRDRSYFERLMDAYGDEAYLFLSSVDPHEREREILERLPQVEQAVNDPQTPHGTLKKLLLEKQNLESELDAMKEVLEKYPGRTFAAGALMIGFGREAEMLYAGMNEDFHSFKPQYLSHFIRFRFLFDRGYEYVSMGGVDGSMSDGLAQYKSKFGAKVREYPGEFDLPVSRILYLAYRAYASFRGGLVT